MELSAWGQEQIVVVADERMPYNGRTGSRMEGYAVEILRAVFESKGYEIQYQPMPWKRAVDDVRSGKADILIGCLQDDHSGFIFPNETLGKDLLCFYTNQPGWMFAGEESLADVMVGLVKGYEYRDWLRDAVIRSPEKFHVMYGDEPVVRLLKMLKDKRIQVLAGNKVVVEYYLKSLGLKDVLFYGGCYADPTDQYLSFAMTSERPERSRKLCDILDKGVSVMRKTGQLNYLLLKYGLKDWIQLR
nr:transporter substrate-binding domain-containing protein [Pseudodesulfovibrio sp. JC047]